MMNNTDFESFMNEIYDIVLHNDKEGVCCFCGKPYNNYGNNAMPLYKGRCCDECNTEYVIGPRLGLAKKGINYATITMPLLKNEDDIKRFKEQCK